MRTKKEKSTELYVITGISRIDNVRTAVSGVHDKVTLYAWCFDSVLKFHLQSGEKRSTYLRMWAEGNTPTEIAEVCGCKPSTVSASVSRSIQFLQRYFRKEKEL